MDGRGKDAGKPAQNATELGICRRVWRGSACDEEADVPREEFEHELEQFKLDLRERGDLVAWKERIRRRGILSSREAGSVGWIGDREPLDVRTGWRARTKSRRTGPTSAKRGSPSKKTPGSSLCSMRSAFTIAYFCQSTMLVRRSGRLLRSTSRGFRRMSEYRPKESMPRSWLSQQIASVSPAGALSSASKQEAKSLTL